jgi:hypothetical protein
MVGRQQRATIRTTNEFPSELQSPPTGGHCPNDGPVREHIIGTAACEPLTAETLPAKAPPMSSANAATVVSILAGMGVLHLENQREATESHRSEIMALLVTSTTI